ETTSKGMVSFSPNQSFTHVHKVCFDQSLAELGGRKWTTMIVLPENEYQANGGSLAYGDAFLAGEGLVIPPDAFNAITLRGSLTILMGMDSTDAFIPGGNTMDKMPRFQTCITDNENGTVTSVRHLPDGSITTATSPGNFTDGQARVIF